MSLNIRWGTRPHVAGDSITVQQWYAAAGGLFDQMNAAAKLVANTGGAAHGASFTGPKGQVSGPAGIVSAAPEAAPIINISAVGGNSFKISDINANYGTFITPFVPLTFLFLECVVNDVVSNTDPATHLAQYGAFLDRVRADSPNVRVLCLGAFCNGEQWLTGPNRYSSGLTGNVWDQNVAACCAARPLWTEYADQAVNTLAYQVANNTPSPGVNTGILTLDGVHPNPTGQVFMATSNVMPHLTFSV